MLITDLLYFGLGLAMIWIASGLVVRGIARFSQDTQISTFASSFLILGVLTSLTEISVGLNAVLDKKPAIFVGNLIGGSFVILMLIIPLLAIFNGGITLRHRLDAKRLLFFLILIFAPSLAALDGTIGRNDAIMMLVLYVLFLNLFQVDEKVLDHLAHTEVMNKRRITSDLLKVGVGAVIIYFAGKILVETTIFFANDLGVPPLLLSLLLLSFGTNLQEMTIAFRSIRQKHAEIAFGDYIGSAATNVLLFGIFTLMAGELTPPTP